MDRDSLLRNSQLLSQDSRLRWTAVATLIGLASYGFWRALHLSPSQKRLSSAEMDDPSLLRKHSTFESYTTASGYVYPKIRTFYKAHQQAEQLPKDLPLLVFMHGLGGSAAQFAPLLTSLINTAPCLAIDLPGCGRSEFAPNDSDAYTTHAFAELLVAAIARHRDTDNNQKVVLVGHSMGCSINALLASSISPPAHLLQGVIVGMIAICPRATDLAAKAMSVNLMTFLPVPLFNILRLIDRRGGLHSHSVTRVVGEGADEETRKLQYRYNEQSQTKPLFRILRMSLGARGLPSKDVWSEIKVPLFLVAGDADKVTPSSEVEVITGWLTTVHPQYRSDSIAESSATAKARASASNENDKPLPPVPTTTGDVSTVEEALAKHQPNAMPPRTSSGGVIEDTNYTSKHSFPLKTTIFPPPAAHGILYATSTVRILSGMIANFLSANIDDRLGAGWQLHTLTKSGKWDVKNLKKWQATEACSVPIGGIFRAMKTMREVDEEHSPKEFVRRSSINIMNDGVAAVIDISHETPVYHPSGLEEAGVDYYKFPTVSKETPKLEEVKGFIALVDEILQSEKFKSPPDAKTAESSVPEGGSPPSRGSIPSWSSRGSGGSYASGIPIRTPTIGVHCHYGFNRTGFFIVSYLVQRTGNTLEDAMEQFRLKRPPGIKHQHFIDELFVQNASLLSG